MTPDRAKISITACSEDWSSMSVNDTGRFCQSCQKSVIDFSARSDEEIKDFLKDKQGQQLCGRFLVHQVERIRIEIDQQLLISDIPFWQKFLAIVLVCFGADFLGCDFVFAQTPADSIPVITEQVDSLIPIQEPDSTAEAIIDSILEPIEFKAPEWGNICTLDSEVFISGMMVLGTTTIINQPPLFPEREKIPLILTDPQEDPLTSEPAGTQASNPGPAVPESPDKKPMPPENAIIADTGERRKTRRS